MKSLRAQLTFRLLAGGVLLLVMAGALLQWQMRRALTAQFDGSLRATLQTVTMLAEQKRGHVSVDFTGADVSQLDRAQGTEVFLLRTVDGHEIARSRSLGTAALPLRAGSVAAPEFFDSTLADGRIVRCAGVRFTPEYEDETVRPPQVDALLAIGLDRRPLDRTSQRCGLVSSSSASARSRCSAHSSTGECAAGSLRSIDWARASPSWTQTRSARASRWRHSRPNYNLLSLG